MGLMKKLFGDYSSRELKSIYPIVDKIEAMADEYKAMTDAQLQAKTPEFKERLANGETLDDILPEAFATVRRPVDRAVRLLFPIIPGASGTRFSRKIRSLAVAVISPPWKRRPKEKSFHLHFC